MSGTDATADRLATLAAYDMFDPAADPALDTIVGDAAWMIDAPIAMISLIDDRRQWFKAKLGVSHDGDPIDQSICAHAIQQDDTFVIGDVSSDPRFADMDAVRGGIGIRFYAGAPLRMRNGVKVGTLCVIDVAPRAGLEADERAALQTLARRTVAAFELRRDMREAARAKLPTGNNAPADAPAFVDAALGHLSMAVAALEQVGATGVLAHIERVITMVDELQAQAGASVAAA